MAIYEYTCPKCDTAKVVNQSIKDYDSTKMVKCPKCRSKMKRKFSPPAVSIK